MEQLNDDSDPEYKGTKYDVGCKCTDKILARGHQDGMLSPSKIPDIEPIRQPVAI